MCYKESPRQQHTLFVFTASLNDFNPTGNCLVKSVSDILPIYLITVMVIIAANYIM